MQMKHVYEEMKQGLRTAGKVMAGAVLVAGLMLPGRARADSIEVMSGKERSTMDLKAGADLTSKLGIFARDRLTVNHKGALGNFALVDGTIGLGSGLAAVGELQLAGGAAIPRAGLEYFGTLGDFSAFIEATGGLGSTTDIEVLAQLGYHPKLSEALSVVAQVEGITNMTATEHVYSLQRLRLGVEFLSWRAGIAADITETKGPIDWMIGGFLGKSF